MFANEGTKSILALYARRVYRKETFRIVIAEIAGTVVLYIFARRRIGRNQVYSRRIGFA